MKRSRNTLFRPVVAVLAVATFGITASQLVALADTALPAWAPSGLSAPFDPATGMFNLKANNTVKTRAALANAGTAQQNTVFVGDSVTAGWNSLSPTFQGKVDRNTSWPYYYRRAMNAKLGLPVESSTGLVRSFELNGYTGPYMDARWSPTTNGVGIQAKGHYVNVTNSSFTFDSAAKNFTPVTGTAIAVTYFDSGTFKVSIDGGAAITVTGTKTGAIKRFVKTGLANKAHKVKIAVGFGVNTQIIGAEVYQNKGISASNVAQGGSGVTGDTQDDWSVPGAPAVSMSAAFSNPTAYSSTPSTVFIALGGNDINSNADNLGAIRDGILETANFYRASDIVIITPAHGSPSFSKVDIKPLLTMLYQLAYDNNWPLWDLEYVTGGYEGLAAQGYVGDTYGHLTPAGHKMLGDKMAHIIANAPRE